MTEKPKTRERDGGSGGGEQANEGEGNRTAARRYNKAQTEFAKSGRVAERAEEAEHSRESSREREELEKAEREGKAKARGEDPKLYESGPPHRDADDR